MIEPEPAESVVELFTLTDTEGAVHLLDYEPWRCLCGRAVLGTWTTAYSSVLDGVVSCSACYAVAAAP